MNKQHLTKDELISAINGISLKDFSVRDLVFLKSILKTKISLIDREISKKKAEGKD